MTHPLIIIMYRANQIDVARSIVQSIQEGHRCHSIVAQTQSGKTGCIAATIHLLQQLTEFRDFLYLVISSMPYKDLRNQTIREMCHNYRVLSAPSQVMFQHQLQQAINHLESSNEVVRAMEKTKYQRVVILQDEAHWGSDRDSTVHRFLKGVGMTPDGLISRWTTENTYLITISATPMAEIADYYNHESEKKIHVMLPGPDYYGFQDMIAEKMLYASSPLNFKIAGGLDTLIQALKNHLVVTKYMLVRIPAGIRGATCRNLDLMRDIADQLQIGFINATSDSDVTDVAQMVLTPPQRATLVVIYHRLRAGIQLDTQNISMVYDHSNNCDVTIQGLAGRCTGYDKKSHRVSVYCHVDRLKYYLEWCRTEYDYEHIPHHSKNIKNGAGSRASQSNHQKHPPLMVQLPMTLIEQFYSMTPAQIRVCYKKYQSLIWKTLRSSSFGGVPSIDSEILGYLSPNGSNGRTKCDITIVTDQSSVTTKNIWWHQLYRHYLRGTPTGFGETQGLDPALNYRALFINAMRSDPHYGQGLIIYLVSCPNQGITTTQKEQYFPFPIQETVSIGMTGDSNTEKLLFPPDIVCLKKLQSTNASCSTNAKRSKIRLKFKPHLAELI